MACCHKGWMLTDMNGIINLYFPCKLKKTRALRLLECKWKHVRNKHNKEIDLMNQPLTDLIYREYYRTDIEDILAEYQDAIGQNNCKNSAPFATPCLRDVYRNMHNDYIFSKNVSIVISTFRLEYKEQINDSSCIRNLPGALLLNVNTENRVATFIICISFNNFTIDECIYLKHVFFKNCKITIKETVNLNKGQLKKKCHHDCIFSEEFAESKGEIKVHTIREYIKQKSPFCNKVLDDNLDLRCRYTYLEIDNLPLQECGNNAEKARNIYALITSDEYYRNYENEKNQKIIDAIIQYKHPSSHYKIYVKGYHALQINNRELPVNYLKYESTMGYIDTNDFFRVKSCIAGISVKNIFPKYLKTVEIHYLINNETTNEISSKERSYVNPFVFIKRAVRLWKVIYEVDTNKYHNSSEFLDSFGIDKLLKELRDEYNSLLVHILGFFTIILTLFTLLFTILSILKP